MKDMCNKIPQTMIKEITPKHKVGNLMTEIGGGCYMGESSNGIPALMISKVSKKEKDNEDEIKKLYNSNKWWND